MEPSEFLFPASAMDSRLKALLDRSCPEMLLRPLEDWLFSPAQTVSLLTTHYELQSLQGLGLEGLKLHFSH